MVLQLMATDDYGSGRNGTTTVHVSLSNVNDHPPAFLQPHYDLNVTENVALRHVVTTFNATDRDNDYRSVAMGFLAAHRQVCCYGFPGNTQTGLFLWFSSGWQHTDWSFAMCFQLVATYRQV